MNKKILGYAKLTTTILPVVLVISLFIVIAVAMMQVSHQLSPFIEQIENVVVHAEDDAEYLEGVIAHDIHELESDLLKVEKMVGGIEGEAKHEIDAIKKEIQHGAKVIASPFKKADKGIENIASKVSSIKVFGKKVHLFSGLGNLLHGITHSILAPFHSLELSFFKLENKLRSQVSSEVKKVEDEISEEEEKIINRINEIKGKFVGAKERMMAGIHAVIEYFFSMIKILLEFGAMVLVIVAIFLFNYLVKKIVNFFSEIEEGVALIKAGG